MTVVRRRPRDDLGVAQLVEVLVQAKLNCTLVLPWEDEIRVGKEDKPQVCRIVLKTEAVLRRPLTEFSLGRAYVEGDLDIEDFDPAKHAKRLFKVRDKLRSGTSPARALRLAHDIALVPPTRANARAIAEHYDPLPDDFFFTFLDKEWPLYSQGRFDGCDLVLEQAAKQKLQHAWNRLELQPGSRVLDVGAGWGTLMRYRNELRADVSITALTLTKDSKKSIKKRGLPRKGYDEVLVEDLLDHRRRSYYDHVLILGVIEHIPNYARFCRRVWDALKPGGLLYLDASATREKYASSAFTRRYTWPGPHSCLDLPGMSRELTYHGFDLLEVEENSDDYRRTMRAWGERLDDNATQIKNRWGEHHYRTWRAFLWGGAAAFETGRLQSYTVVARKRKDKGPRPGSLRRAAQIAASLR